MRQTLADLFSPQMQAFFKKALAKSSKITIGVTVPETEASFIPMLRAADENIARFIFLGSVKKMQTIAKAADYDLARYECIDLDEAEAVKKTMEMARDGEIQAIMKGSLHTDTFMSAVVNRETGLRTNRRITHCMLMDIPTYHKPLIITDAAFNVLPTLPDKKDIVQNAIDLALTLGIETPKVALLSSTEVISPKVPSTLDCDSLTKMAAAGEIKGGIVEGPMAFDVAISKEAAAIKGIKSQVSGDPDIIFVPNLDAGNICFKALEYLIHAKSFGIGLGAKVPIILVSRAAAFADRVGSCILAACYMKDRVR
jgi:phosphate acetyltransferase